MSYNLEDILKNLHSSLARKLLERIESGEATAAEFTAAIKFLKDNGIDLDASQAPEDHPVNQLADKVPFPDTDEQLPN